MRGRTAFSHSTMMDARSPHHPHHPRQRHSLKNLLIRYRDVPPICPPCGLIHTSLGEPERISKNKSSTGTCVSRMPLMTSMGAEGLSSKPAVLRDIFGP